MEAGSQAANTFLDWLLEIWNGFKDLQFPFDYGPIIHSDINHVKSRHSWESRNPGKNWIPGQARNDKPLRTYVVMYNKRTIGYEFAMLSNI